MEAIIILLISAVVGYFLVPKENKIILEIIKYVQLGCTLILIFSMGAMLGAKENFFDDLLNLGLTSVILCIVPVIFSIICVFFLSKKFIYKKKEDKK